MKQKLVSLLLFLLVGWPVQGLPARQPEIIYQVFPRSFQDGGSDGTGDLDGVVKRLDYIKDLGADSIWLTPIHESPSYHGYDATDFYSIHRDFGTQSSMDQLIDQADRRGLRVMLDLAVNHSSIKHGWFTKRRDLYLWSAVPLPWSKFPVDPGYRIEDYWHRFRREFFFASFGGGNFADFDWRKTSVMSEIKAVFRHWIERGVGGFRLDAAKYLVKGPEGELNTPETHRVWKELAREMHALHSETYLLGEIWDSPEQISTYYGQGDELDGAFDFPTCHGLRDSLKSHSGRAFAQALRDRIRVQPTVRFATPFLGNHDMARIASEVGGDIPRLKLAALAYLSLPGPVTIYYGDEIGLPNGSLLDHAGDRAKRTPMQWSMIPGMGFTQNSKPWLPFSKAQASLTVETQSRDPQSLLNTYRNLLRLRQQSETLRDGEIVNVREPEPGVVTFVRKSGDGGEKDLLIVLNFSFRPAKLFRVLQSTKARKLFGLSDETEPTIKAHSGAIFELL